MADFDSASVSSSEDDGPPQLAVVAAPSSTPAPARKKVLNDVARCLKEDIDLAFETMQYLGTVSQQTRDTFDIRSLLVNLCDMQQRFSVPQDMPFEYVDEETREYIEDVPGCLETPRPVGVLRSYGAALPCPDECVVEADGEYFVEGENGERLCLAGGDSWERMVASGRLSGRDAEPVTDSVWLWLPTLFEVFAAEREAPTSRRLAACWYYIATEVDFLEGERDEDNQAEAAVPEAVEEKDRLPEVTVTEQAEAAATGGVRFGSAIVVPATDQFSSDEDDDEEEEDEKKQKQSVPEKKKQKSAGVSFGSAIVVPAGDAFSSDDEKDSAAESSDEEFVPDDDEESEDFDEEDEEGVAAAGGGVLDLLGSLANAITSHAEGGASAQSIFNMLGQGAGLVADGGGAESEQERAQLDKIRRGVLDAIGVLDAYLPNPATDRPFFTRMLKKMQSVEDDRWFPFGLPPLQHIVECLTRNPADDDRGKFLRDILTIFVEHEQGEEVAAAN